MKYNFKNPISIPFFIASFFCGLFLSYLLGPLTKTVYVYPNPNNVNKILFQDNADNCYKFELEKMTCPTDSSKIQTIPIQI